MHHRVVIELVRTAATEAQKGRIAPDKRGILAECVHPMKWRIADFRTRWKALRQLNETLEEEIKAHRLLSAR